MSDPSANEVEVNGVCLHYVERGSGEPMVFVHGVPVDLRMWERIGESIAKRYRFIAYNQRYCGTGPWPDDGRNFSVATHAKDLAEFITSLNAGPVHLVGYSYGGQVATTAAVQNPSLVRSLILFEAAVMSVLPKESAEGKAAREDFAKMTAPAVAAAKAGEPVQATKLLFEALFQTPPGEFHRLPQDWQTLGLDNARTLPLLLTSPPPPPITCEMLKDFTRPTLVMWGERTQRCYALANEAISRCVPGARKTVLRDVNHDWPLSDPGAFSAAVLEFLSKGSGC